MSRTRTSLRAIGLVTRREIGAQVRSRSFLAISIALVAAVLGIVVAGHYLGRGQQPVTRVVGVTAQAAPYQQLLVGAGQTAGQRIEIVPVDRMSGESRVRGGELSALFTGVTDGRLQVVVKSGLPSGLRTGFDVLARQIALDRQIGALGGDPAAAQHAVSTAVVDSRSLQPADDHRAALIGIASIVGVLLYVMLLISMRLTGRGVVEEKADRLAELLLATMRPWELLAGKVVGIGAVTIGQMAIVLAVGAGTATALGVLHLSGALLAAVAGWTLLWYLLGYVLYALVIAAAAALVSRREDLPAVTTPVSVVLVAACVIGQLVVPFLPNGVVAVVMSFIPMLSPVVMPVRAVYGVPGWQMGASVAITVLTIGIAWWFAGRVHANALLHTGSRMSLRAAMIRTSATPDVPAPDGQPGPAGAQPADETTEPTAALHV